MLQELCWSGAVHSSDHFGLGIDFSFIILGGYLQLAHAGACHVVCVCVKKLNVSLARKGHFNQLCSVDQAE